MNSYKSKIPDDIVYKLKSILESGNYPKVTLVTPTNRYDGVIGEIYANNLYIFSNDSSLNGSHGEIKPSADIVTGKQIGRAHV